MKLVCPSRRLRLRSRSTMPRTRSFPEFGIELEKNQFLLKNKIKNGFNFVSLLFSFLFFPSGCEQKIQSSLELEVGLELEKGQTDPRP